LGASRYLADLGAQNGAPKLLSEAAKLADSSRQNLLAAHELCAREAKARPKPSWADTQRAREATAAAYIKAHPEIYPDITEDDLKEES
jgi:hypothetical protein